MKGEKVNRTYTLISLGMLLAVCFLNPPVAAGRSTELQLIIGKTWQWEATVTPAERIIVPAPERYTLLLKSGGRADIRFDCNRGGGGYRISNGKLSFDPMVSTRMACPEGSLDNIFMRDLQRVLSFFVENGQLYLELPHDSGTMRFREAQ